MVFRDGWALIKVKKDRQRIVIYAESPQITYEFFTSEGYTDESLRVRRSTREVSTDVRVRSRLVPRVRAWRISQEQGAGGTLRDLRDGTD